MTQQMQAPEGAVQVAAATNDMSLRLVEYATAGFAWEVTKQENCNILFNFYEPPGPGSPIGAPGIRHTEVRFNNGGPAELVMTEKRPWEQGETARRLSVTLA